MVNLSKRVEALEKIDTEVLDAVGSSLREIVDKNDAANETAINAMALDIIKKTLQAFPEHTQQYVLSLFQERIDEAVKRGYERGCGYSRSSRTTENPKVNDLLGLKGIEDG